jgi:hypothetical protein
MKAVLPKMSTTSQPPRSSIVDVDSSPATAFAADRYQDRSQTEINLRKKKRNRAAKTPVANDDASQAMSAFRHSRPERQWSTMIDHQNVMELSVGLLRLQPAAERDVSVRVPIAQTEATNINIQLNASKAKLSNLSELRAVAVCQSRQRKHCNERKQTAKMHEREKERERAKTELWENGKQSGRTEFAANERRGVAGDDRQRQTDVQLDANASLSIGGRSKWRVTTHTMTMMMTMTMHCLITMGRAEECAERPHRRRTHLNDADRTAHTTQPTNRRNHSNRCMLRMNDDGRSRSREFGSPIGEKAAETFVRAFGHSL